MKQTKGNGPAGRKTPAKNDEARSGAAKGSETGKAGRPQTTTAKRTAAKPAVTSGSRLVQKRASRSPKPQTKRAMTPKETVHHLYEQTKVTQTDVINVCRALAETAGQQLRKWGMFTFPEIGIRVWREPMPQTGRAAGRAADAEAGEIRGGETQYVLRAVPLKRLLVATGAARSD